ADAGVVAGANGVWPLGDLAYVGERAFRGELRWRGGGGDRVGGLGDAPNDERAEDKQAGDGAGGAAQRGGMHAPRFYTRGGSALPDRPSSLAARGMTQLTARDDGRIFQHAPPTHITRVGHDRGVRQAATPDTTSGQRHTAARRPSHLLPRRHASHTPAP